MPRLYKPEEPRAVVDSTNMTVEDMAVSLVDISARAREYDRDGGELNLKAMVGLLARHKRLLERFDKRVADELRKMQRPAPVITVSRPELRSLRSLRQPGY